MKKTSLIVLFMLLLCSLAFAQEEPQNSQPAEPDKNLVVIQKGDFTVKIKTDSNIASNDELKTLAGKIVDKFREKIDSDSMAIGCNIFIASRISPSPTYMMESNPMASNATFSFLSISSSFFFISSLEILLNLKIAHLD